MKRVALVTGGSRGIGAAVARQLAQDGRDVAIQYYSAWEAAEAVLSDCKRFGVQAVAVQADLRAKESTLGMKQRLDELGWEPDIVVHCAGMAHYGLLDDMEEQIWDDLMNVNLKGAYYLTRWFGPRMRWKRWGRFVHLSSIWGEVGASGEAAYAASKGGLNAFTKSMAKEMASSYITVNSVSPGAIETDMLTSLDSGDRERLYGEIPLGRLGQATEVAMLVRFLVSEEAGYITGQTIGLNGGWKM
ncbi:elongation factor P 5-aminopentanone reductase [Cohnella lupini]|uniref:3-oxoacyl-[acyl-carrier protein] reductase n=1 Tax=Cohnella lupini TaxID=1294267 RepID=A0A3D9IWQ7_9BACL|nr:SDR family oxidoreductase [Cohnella lupini]RED66094.1 3-oxoacyl-[acyl-carrier protein] reductase [Cohnella lupini]